MNSPGHANHLPRRPVTAFAIAAMAVALLPISLPAAGLAGTGMQDVADGSQARMDGEVAATPAQNWRSDLLAAREAIWVDYYSNPDKLALALSDDLITIDGSGFEDKAAALANSRRAVADGTRLRRIAFPRTEIQRYGDVAIIYTTFEMTLATGNDAPTTLTGTATEFFVWRGGAWLHTGWHLAMAS